ncbi:MAG: hypothetical protein J5J00_14595 [Deltaproteobacteria bacterium]|nr:hypothetical protein [Deltaproteobacteria bacterium]
MNWSVWDRIRIIGSLLIAAPILILNIFVIPVSWDEGWNFCVARTLVENQHFGCKILGELTTARLMTGVAGVLPAALGFELLGINHVAARLIVGIQTALALLIFIWLTAKCFGPAIGSIVPIVWLASAPDSRVHPLLVGAQGWGELPLVFYLICGLLILCQEPKSVLFRWVAALLATLFLALALFSKIQLQPFLCASFFGAAFLCWMHRKSRWSLQLLTLFAGAWIGYEFFQRLPLPHQNGAIYEGTGTSGLHAILGVSLSSSVRWSVASFSFENLLPNLVALTWWGWAFIRKLKVDGLNSKTDLVKVLLWILCTSWFAWFLLLSINFARYAAPPAVLSTPFLAAMLHEIYSRTRSYLVDARNSGRQMRVPKAIAHSLTLLALAVVLRSIIYCVGFIRNHWDSNKALYETAHFVNHSLGPAGLVETYDSQLFFLLDVPFHYPPDQFHVEAIAEGSGRSVTQVPYDPTFQKPDLIIEGPWSRSAFKVYRELIEENGLKPIRSFGEFDIYSLAE